MNDKDFKIRFSARDEGAFGRVIQDASNQLKELRTVATSFGSLVTGGLVGGGMLGFFNAVFERVTSALQQAKELRKTADEINVNTINAQQLRNLEAGTGQQGLFVGAVQAARRRRADALAGDPQAIADFERIGVSLREIKDMNPADMFYRVAAAFETFDSNAKGARERFFAGANIFGGTQAAENLIPFFAGGLLKERRLFGGSGDIFAAALDGDPSALSRYKKDFEPFSGFGIDTASKAAKLAEANRYRAVELLRQQLPLEEQIKRILIERMQIEREMAGAPSALRREQLFSRILDADTSLFGLRAKKAEIDSKVIPGATFNRNLDELSRAGLFTGGVPSEFIDTGRKQLEESKRQTTVLQQLPERIANRL